LDEVQFKIIYDNLPDLAIATGKTLQISILSFIIALFIGTIVGVVRSKPGRFEKMLSMYVEVFRGTPLLVQLYFIYYGLPTLGFNMSGFSAALVGLGLNGGAYISEIIRASVLSVDRGQEEAARALGLTRYQTLVHVILPQALRMAIPPLVNSFSSILKESSLVSVLAICEVTRLGQLIYTRTFKAFEIYLVIGCIYLILTFTASKLSRYLEQRFKYA